jgi:hypothetical protein
MYSKRHLPDIEQWSQRSGSNVIPRRARPGLAGLGPHTCAPHNFRMFWMSRTFENVLDIERSFENVLDLEKVKELPANTSPCSSRFRAKRGPLKTF